MSKNKIEVIFSDEDIVVINKPSGISVTKDRSGQIDLLDAIAKQKQFADEKLLLVHRLDKPTSGVMVLARNKQTQSRLSSAFEKRKVKKDYLAIVSGYTSSDEGTIDSPIARDRKDNVKMRLDKRGKDAVTGWEVISDFGLYLLIKASPLTGRTHQIRVHLSSIGLPLAIDPLYGGNKPLMLSDIKLKYKLKKDQKERPLIDRLTLHAYQLKLPGYDKIFIAGFDKHFSAAVKMLSKYGKDADKADKQDTIGQILDKIEI